MAGIRRSRASLAAAAILAAFAVASRPGPGARAADAAAGGSFDPGLVIWSDRPAETWESALPVGNGRLGAMVFGKTDEERIQINEDTYWTGGPYATTVKGGAAALPEIRRLIFDGRLVEAHRLFGRTLMGYPVEQQKYQSLGNIVLKLEGGGEVRDYRRALDLDAAVATTSYERGGTRFTREAFVSPVDQVLVIRLAADRPGAISFAAELRGERNPAHSDYATDYFRMDGLPPDGLAVRGRSADYLGIAGRLRTEARLAARAEGGRTSVEGATLSVRGADAVTLLVAAATNFVSYKDVTGDPRARIEAALGAARGKPYEALKSDHLREHRRLFRRASLRLDASDASARPTGERLKAFEGGNDPALAGLIFQFGRYLLISSSRPGTQPANLQGIWNQDMNPAWDSKYTTNINAEMNYWPAEPGNLAECAEPLFRMIAELTDQGADVAREHYGCRGWVAHQNTDLWRVAAPMDGPSWGAFTTGGAWLCSHLWEHFLFTGDKEFLRAAYPVLRGSAEFFLDFLVPHPVTGRLVTNPSTSPENFPDAPGNGPFFDEVTAFVSDGTTLCAGSTIDLQVVGELFDSVAEASSILGLDPGLRERIRTARARLAPLAIGWRGDLQEWLDDWGQKEKSHRHISNLFGLFPGRSISARRTPELAAGCRAVLEQRGLPGNGWSSAWKTACWARLGEGDRALENLVYACRRYTYPSLFSMCGRALQVDGSLGSAAAIAEMLVQSHEGEISLLPALPAAWPKGELKGLRARGGFEIDLAWSGSRIERTTIRSLLGNLCRLRSASELGLEADGTSIPVARPAAGVMEFPTRAGGTYRLAPRTSGP